MTVLLGFSLTGLVAGALYALMASGLVLSYAATGVLNFAQGAIGFVAALTYFELHSGLHWPTVPAAVLAIGIVAPGLGWALHRMMFDRLSRSGETAQIVATIGLLVALPALALWLLQTMIDDFHWQLPSTVGQAAVPGLGPSPAKHFHPGGGVTIDTDQVATFTAAAVAAVGLWLVMNRSRLGLSMRATSDRREMAVLRGIDAGRASALAWMLSSGLAGLAGVLAAPLIGLDANGFTLLLFQSATAAVFGLLRSIPLTFASGLLLGVVQNLTAGYADFAKNVPGFRTAVPVLLLFLGLLLLNRDRGRVAGSVAEDAPPPDYLADLPRWRRLLPWSVSVVVLLVYLFTFATPFWLGILAQGFGFAIILLSFVIVTGIGGMVSFAQATFVTSAALTTGLLYAKGVPFLPAVLAGVAAATLLGVVVALPALRLGGRILALGTLALALLGDSLLFQLRGFSNSGLGWTYPPVAIGPFQLGDTRTVVVFLLIVTGLITLVIGNLTKSASGRAMLAVRSGPAAATTSGISATKAKLALFALSAAIAGLGGIIYAVFNGRSGPTDFPALTGFLWLAVVVTQGVRRPSGVIIAGLLTAVVPQLLSYVTSSSYLPSVLFGLGGVVLARQPDGAIAQFAEQRYMRRRKKREAALVAEVEETEHRADPVARTPSHGGTVAAEPVPEGPAGTSSVLSLQGVWASYGDVPVLRNVELSVPSGSVVALLGANGAGKSTLCKTVGGLLTPRQGKVLFQGEDTTGHSPDRLARDGLFFAPEARGIFPGLSVEDNLATWLPSASQREQVYDRFPVLGDRRKAAAGVLSGGEQQILALAPMLLRPPVLAVADEPSLGLAPRIVDQIFALFTELRDQGVSLLLAEEKATDVLEIADRVVFMRGGEIVWSGPRSEVDAGSLMEAYLGFNPSTTDPERVAPA
ncbi:ABC transporter permease subunit [Streptomyces spiralis]|uniref:ABC transporter permease subunit n=1 Tax=Streptomyces spiralis TaxID=66376 RepID=UPI0033F61ADA